MIKENVHYQTIVEALRGEYPEVTEEEIKKMAILEFDVLYCYQKLSFEDKEYKYRDLKWIRAQLVAYGQIDSSTTAVDIQRAIDGNVKRNRLYYTHFTDSGITKYKYNVKYIQAVKKPNPFESDDYRNIMSGVKT